MAGFSNFEGLLLHTQYRLESFSQQITKHPDEVPAKQFQTLASELKLATNSLLKALSGAAPPAFNEVVIKTLLTDINKIKKQSTLIPIKGKSSQKEVFVKVLNNFQDLLKELRKIKKNHEKGKEGSSLKTRPVIQMQGVKAKRETSPEKKLDKQLAIANAKLSHLSKTAKKHKLPATSGPYRTVTTCLKKTNQVLSQAQSFYKNFSEKRVSPESARAIKQLLEEIELIQTEGEWIESQIGLDPNVDEPIISLPKNLDPAVQAKLMALNPSVQFMVGTAKRQIDLFWDVLKEFQALLKELERLKETRGKKTAFVEEQQA